MLLTDDLRKAVSTAIAVPSGFVLKDDVFTYDLRLTATEFITKNGKAYIVVSTLNDSALNDVRSINVYPYFTDFNRGIDGETLVSVFEIEAQDDNFKVEDISWLC